jgi:NAD(P)-dependent dehydrogenase (short-subunit alcohol dehydrogenase family)
MAPKIETALVTGGSRGLGRSLVLALTKGGSTVYTIARKRRGLDALKRAASAEALDLTCLQGDLSDLGTSRRIIRRITRDSKSLDLVVHNAGILGPRAPLANWSRREFDRVIAANLSAPFDLTRRLLPHLSPGAAVVFISSGVTQGVRQGWGAYQISKVAMESMATIFAAELGDKGPTIAIVDPGPMQTEMRAAAYPAEDPGTLPDPDEVARQLLEIVPEFIPARSGERWAL